jgi:uncharacterized protein Yka (UPF0111/DUF47 family)
VEEKEEMLMHIHLMLQLHQEIKLLEDQVDQVEEVELQIIFHLLEEVEQVTHHQ